MATTSDIIQALEKWIERLKDPEVAQEFDGYYKTMQFVFPDIDARIQLVFEGPKAFIVEGYKENADMGLTVSSDMFMSILTGEADPMDLFMEGKLKPVGAMPDLEKLQVLVDTEV